MTLRLVVSNPQGLAPGTTWIGDDGPTDLSRLVEKVGDHRTAVGTALHRWAGYGWSATPMGWRSAAIRGR